VAAVYGCKTAQRRALNSFNSILLHRKEVFGFFQIQHKGRFNRQSETGSVLADLSGGFFRPFFARSKKGQTFCGNME